jgi:hypothetical protein
VNLYQTTRRHILESISLEENLAPLLLEYVSFLQYGCLAGSKAANYCFKSQYCGEYTRCSQSPYYKRKAIFGVQKSYSEVLGPLHKLKTEATEMEWTKVHVYAFSHQC